MSVPSWVKRLRRFACLVEAAELAGALPVDDQRTNLVRALRKACVAENLLGAGLVLTPLVATCFATDKSWQSVLQAEWVKIAREVGGLVQLQVEAGHIEVGKPSLSLVRGE